MKTAQSLQCSHPTDLPEAPHLAKRLGRFAIALGFFWFIVYVVAPIPVKYFEPLRKYAEVVDRTNIKPGALYYSDVAQSLDSEINNRDAIRFFVAKQSNSTK